MHTGVCLGNVQERDYVEDLVIGGRVVLKWVLKEIRRRLWTGLIWL